MITQLLYPFEHFGSAHLGTVIIGLVCAYLGTFLVISLLFHLFHRQWKPLPWLLAVLVMILVGEPSSSRRG